jgi:hypothetical protein
VAARPILPAKPPKRGLAAGTALLARDRAFPGLSHQVPRVVTDRGSEGVSVDFHMWAGGFHAFDMTAGHATGSRASSATREGFIRRALDA